MGDSQLWFDFSEFVRAARQDTGREKKPSRPRDFPFEAAYNDLPEHTFLHILFEKIELTKQHVPTKRGWKALHTLLGIYRSKRYETFRYLLLDKDGKIVDHAALTGHSPNRAKLTPDTMPPDEYFRKLAEYASKNEYKIVMVHNHPSGAVEPSDEDREITEYCRRVFKKHFAGHIILDHGSFALYLPGRDWEMIDRKTAENDPLIKENRGAFFQYELNGALSPDAVKALQYALQIDDGDRWNTRDWVAVAFASGWGYLKALHYYHTAEFSPENAAEAIVKKTAGIAFRSGAVWAFAITDNEAMAEPIERITRKTGIFRDYYVNGVMGNSLRIGGSVSRYFETLPTEVTSTILIAPDKKPSRQNKKVPPPNAAASGSAESKYPVDKESTAMQEPVKRAENKAATGEGALSREKHRALVEFLSRCGNMDDAARYDAFYAGITGLRDFQFLKGLVPRQDEADWPRFREAINERYNGELRRYYERFPGEPLPDPFSPPALREDGERVSPTPADFLEAAARVSTATEYRAVCAEFPSFAQGTVKAVSPQKIALFHEKAALPLLLADNTPENWAKLYTRANDNGIAVNNLLPDPAEVESLGPGIIREARERGENARSVLWQIEEFRRTCAGGQGSPDPVLLCKDFYEHPYTAGTAVPSFRLQEADGFTAYEGLSFQVMGDEGSVTLAGKSPEENGGTVTVSAPFYQAMIDNAGKHLNKPGITPEVLDVYDKMIARDAEETRPNTAADFWHNYKILCRRQASNPQEAMEVAKAIVSQMPPREQEKFRRNIKTYEQATKKLSTNPLLRPFVKPQETYNQRILNYYEESVKDLPIKNTGVSGPGALAVNRRGLTRRDIPGQAISPGLRLKIGDTVKLALDCKTLFGQRRKRLPVTSFTVVSASEDLNKVVLLDKTGNSKYTLAKDTFTEKMRKLERKLRKQQHRRDKFESIRY